MSKEKAAALAALPTVDMAIYRAKRNQRSYWQRLSHQDWVKFCKTMGDWFLNKASDEWDEYVVKNNARKKASDEEALKKAMTEKINRKKNK